MVVLSKEEIHGKLASTNGWWLAGEEISKDYSFDTEEEAEIFTDKMKGLSERIGHHPTLSAQGTQVLVTSHSHDEGGITHRDLHFAHEAEKIAVASKRPVLAAIMR